MAHVKDNVLLQIKQDLESHVGQRIKIKANKGRRKVVERKGILERVYPSIFTIRLEEDRRVSYSYSDILTQSVELIICSDESLDVVN